MPHILAALLALLQLIAPALNPDEPVMLLRSGQWLRFHVIAHDDSDSMQRLKLRIRDAVQTCYAARRPQNAPMLDAAAALLPELTQAARSAARSEGFTGDVAVALGVFPFDARELGSFLIPAGEYPALIIRLGDAQGRNWWGLLDPETSLRFAFAGEAQTGSVLWDWSWDALLAALLGQPLADGS